MKVQELINRLAALNQPEMEVEVNIFTVPNPDPEVTVPIGEPIVFGSRVVISVSQIPFPPKEWPSKPDIDPNQQWY